MRTTRAVKKKPTTGPAEGLLARDGSPVPLLGVSVTGRLQGRAAEITVAQRYRNTGAKPLETTYLFPLPSDAAVCGLEVRTGDRVLRGEVEERERAFDLYDRAMAKGDGAVLLDQERENAFHLSVGNLLPGQEAVVSMRLCWRAESAGGATRLLIPTTVAPRYSPASLTDEQRREVERTTPDYALDVPYGFTLAIDVDAGAPLRTVESPSHPVRVTLAGTSARVELARGTEAMDRDFVLLAATDAPGEATLVASRANGRDHLLLELVPSLPAPAQDRPRDVRFLVDCSGSMDGTSIEEARRAVELCLRALRDGDRFQIARFGNTFELLSKKPLAYSQESLDKAVAAVRAMLADLGGTDILPALEALAGTVKGSADLIVLTDGQVSNEDSVIAFLERQRGKLRVFSFGIGASSSEALVKGLARATGGAAEFIAPGERIEAKVLRQFGRISAPALADVRVDWGVAEAEQSPEEAPPLFQGNTVAVAARLPAGVNLAEGAAVTVSGATAAGRVSWTARAVRLPDGGAVPLWWARERIRDLEAGHGLPAGSRQRRGEDRQRRALVALSKEYGIASSETSFVAVEERAAGERAKGPAELRRVPVMIPAGWHGTGRRDSRVLACMISPSPGPRRMALMKPSISRDYVACEDRRVSAREFDLSEPADAVYEILFLQRADGSLPLSGKLLAIVKTGGKALDHLRSLVPELSCADPDTVFATALAMAFLHAQNSIPEPVWHAAARKAMEWLEKQVGGELANRLVELAAAHLGRTGEDVL